MPFARLIDQFDERAGRCTSQAELAALLGDVVRELDFDHFALLHHASLRAGGAGLIRLDNYPSGWSLELVASGFAPDDPVHLACGRTNIGFAWGQLGALVPLTSRHRQILARSARHGLGEGFTVPANVPGEPGGSCSFAVRKGRRLPMRNLACAELLGARTEMRPRERQCLRLIAAGKSDWEIARILGIAEATARQYAKRARAAYDVVSRTQLVVYALRDAWIGFDEAIPPGRGMG